MRQNLRNITRPIGLDALCDHILHNAQHAPVYARCGIRPDHLILCMDSGSGRTTILTYMLELYKLHGVMGVGAPDDFLEVTFDGTLPQLARAFLDIETSCMIYQNIVAMDACAIARHLNETQLQDFLCGIDRVCENACVVFFFPMQPNKSEERLISMIEARVQHIRRIDAVPYTPPQLAALVEKFVAELGVQLKKDVTKKVLLDLCCAAQITDIKAAQQLARGIAFEADYSSFTPVVDAACIRLLTDPNTVKKKG